MMTISGYLGGIARNRRQHGAAQAVRGRSRPPGRQRARRAPPLTARTPWYGEGKQQDRPMPYTNPGKRSAQARQGRRRQPSVARERWKPAGARLAQRGLMRSTTARPDRGRPKSAIFEVSEIPALGFVRSDRPE